MCVCDKEKSVRALAAGEQVYCINNTPNLETYLTVGKLYTIESVREQEGRIVVTDDRGKEGWFKASRFKRPKRAKTQIR